MSCMKSYESDPQQAPELELPELSFEECSQLKKSDQRLLLSAHTISEALDCFPLGNHAQPPIDDTCYLDTQDLHRFA